MIELAELVDELEERYPDDAELAVAIVVVEVRWPSPDEDGGELTSVHTARAAGGVSETCGALDRAVILTAIPQAAQDDDDDD